MDILPDGFHFLALAAVLAGVVRGFSGFGTAMVYLPIAAQVLGPFEALTTLVIIDLFGPLPNVRAAWRDAAPYELARLGIGMVISLPLGLLVLALSSDVAFRYAVSCISLVLLVVLISGWRYRKAIAPKTLYLTGAASGFLAGVAGLTGPPVILLYMSGTQAVASIRANTLLFLLLSDILLLGILALGHVLVPAAIITGFLVMPVYLLANIAGAAIFNPGYARLYRGVAYLVIAMSALMGLPIWDT